MQPKNKEASWEEVMRCLGGVTIEDFRSLWDLCLLPLRDSKWSSAVLTWWVKRKNFLFALDKSCPCIIWSPKIMRNAAQSPETSEVPIPRLVHLCMSVSVLQYYCRNSRESIDFEWRVEIAKKIEYTFHSIESLLLKWVFSLSFPCTVLNSCLFYLVFGLQFRERNFRAILSSSRIKGNLQLKVKVIGSEVNLKEDESLFNDSNSFLGWRRLYTWTVLFLPMTTSECTWLLVVLLICLVCLYWWWHDDGHLLSHRKAAYNSFMSVAMNEAVRELLREREPPVKLLQ